MLDIKDLNIACRPLTDEQKQNLLETTRRLNLLQPKFGSLFKVTRGFSTPEDQIHVYQQRGITDISKIPMHSQHLNGNAVDIYDPRKTLQMYLLSEKGLQAIEDIGFWCEHFDYTPTWVHLQTVAPHSGSRFFIPF